MDETDLVGMVVGGARSSDDCVRVPHYALVSTLAKPVSARPTLGLDLHPGAERRCEEARMRRSADAKASVVPPRTSPIRISWEEWPDRAMNLRTPIAGLGT
jgi:hypothetical protein